MDNLDRLFYQFVEIIRRERPSDLKEPLCIQEVHDQLIPYRRVRNSVGFRSNDHYQATLSRLLSGERAYLLGDRAVQEELVAGLNEAIPDIRRYLEFPDARVWLNPKEIPPPGDVRYAPPDVRERIEGEIEQTVASATEDGEDGSTALAASAELAEERVEVAPVAEAAEAESESPARELEDTRATEIGLETSAEDAGAQSPSERAEVPPLRCAECGADLPERFNYCPFCGRPLLNAECAVCGGTLQPAWGFCPDCGSARGAQPEPGP